MRFRRVTDKDTLMQLNGKQVTDPNLIAQLNAPSTSDKVSGALLSPVTSQSSGERKKLPQEEFSNPTQYPGFQDLPKKEQMQRIGLSQFDPGNQTGVGTMVPPGAYQQPATRMGGELLLNALLPEGNLASPFLNSLMRAGAGTALNAGFAQANPDNKNNLLQNVKEQGLVNTALEAIPYGGGKLLQAGKKILSPWRPGSKAEELIGHLGSGVKTSEENAQSFSNEVMQAHKNHYDNYTKKVEPVMQKYGDKDLYLTHNAEGVSTFKPYDKLEIDTTDKYLKKRVNEFNGNPTFRNAHELQSEIGAQIGQLRRMPPSIEGKNSIAALKEARDSVKQSQDAFLANVDPASREAYKESSDYFKKNIIPYRSDKTLRKIIEGEETNPKNLHGIFEYPTEKINKKTMERQMGPIEKVVSDLTPETRNRILHSKVGAHKVGMTDQKLLNTLQEAKQAGYSKYFTHEIDQFMQDLGARIERSAHAKKAISGIVDTGSRVAGATAGYFGGHMIGQELAVAGSLAGLPFGGAVKNALLAMRPKLPSMSDEVKNVVLKGTKNLLRASGSEMNAFNKEKR